MPTYSYYFKMNKNQIYHIENKEGNMKWDILRYYIEYKHDLHASNNTKKEHSNSYFEGYLGDKQIEPHQTIYPDMTICIVRKCLNGIKAHVPEEILKQQLESEYMAQHPSTYATEEECMLYMMDKEEYIQKCLQKINHKTFVINNKIHPIKKRMLTTGIPKSMLKLAETEKELESAMEDPTTGKFYIYKEKNICIY